jgi:hypothetical protein
MEFPCLNLRAILPQRIRPSIKTMRLTWIRASMALSGDQQIFSTKWACSNSDNHFSSMILL